MIDITKIDYSILDRPDFLAAFFHPRPEWSEARQVKRAEDMLIPVEEELFIGARFHRAGKADPTILYFHGNGEIVADYDDLGPMYTGIGINFLPVDYRGYGRSNGSPTVTGMMRDCHTIFSYIKKWLHTNAYTGNIIIMGRSIGSASALELAAHYQDEIDGLIIESGFAYVVPLLKLLGIDVEALGIREEKGFRNIDKIRKFYKPTLIIHAEYDHIIPFSNGQALFDDSPATSKKLLKIPGADHNTIFAYGMENYLKAIKDLTETLLA
jgi:fermentation-respiration switch protein FrsA (DUF1100 family)